MSRLTPFGVCLLMAMAAVLGSRESFGINELTSVCRCIRWQEGLIGTESKVVMFFDCFGVDFPLSGSGDDIRGMGAVSLRGNKK